MEGVPACLEKLGAEQVQTPQRGSHFMSDGLCVVYKNKVIGYLNLKRLSVDACQLTFLPNHVLMQAVIQYQK